MKVFVTGASGHVASALIPELQGAGHEVTGLACSDTAAGTVSALGAEVVRGSLDDLDILRESAKAADGVIHLAFKHDEMNAGDFGAAVSADLRAVEALCKSLAGTGKPLVGTSGTLSLILAGVEGEGHESDAGVSGPRIDAENLVIAMADRGVRASIVRLPPTVHSSLDLQGFVPMLIRSAREKKRAGYVGDGTNRWPAVHTLDAARLYRLALEAAPAGTRLHAVQDWGVPFRSIAETIGRHLGVTTESIPEEQVGEYFEGLALVVGLDNPTSSSKTRKLLGWEPTHAGLLADLDAGHYFAT
jgi:nucleoside-diphosphate-sugar epimerase